MIEYLLGVTQSIVAAILYDAASGRYRGFNSVFEKGLEDTSAYFTKEHGIEFDVSQFRRMLKGDASAEEIEKLKGAAGLANSETLALTFAQLGGVWFEDYSVTVSIAREILQYFIGSVESYLLADPKTNPPCQYL
jgi:hypothetical protein